MEAERRGLLWVVTNEKPVQRLRLSELGKNALNNCKTMTRTYRFASTEALRLYEVGILKCPTGDLRSDKYIEGLLKKGYLEIIPEDTEPYNGLDQDTWMQMNKGLLT